jgi:hypothetical protein
MGLTDMQNMNKYELTDAQWLDLEPALPPQKLVAPS